MPSEAAVRPISGGPEEMTANESGRNGPGNPAAEPTAVLPETAAQLVELERLQQALADSEERARSHWEQYLRAVADLDNVRKRAAARHRGGQPLRTREVRRRAAAGEGQPGAGGAERRRGRM